MAWHTSKVFEAPGLPLLLVAFTCACISLASAQFTTPSGCDRLVTDTVFYGDGISCTRDGYDAINCGYAENENAVTPGLQSFSANDIRGKVIIDAKWNGTEDECCQECCSRKDCTRAEYTWTGVYGQTDGPRYAVCVILTYEPTADDLGTNYLEIVALTGCGAPPQASPPGDANGTAPPTTMSPVAPVGSSPPLTAPSLPGSPPTLSSPPLSSPLSKPPSLPPPSPTRNESSPTSSGMSLTSSQSSTLMKVMVAAAIAFVANSALM